MRRINFLTGLLLAAAMVLIGGETAMAQTFTATANGVEWICIPLGNDPTACSVTPKDNSAISGAVTIPAEVVDAGGEKFSVTQIGESAFYGCSGLKEVTIPGGVTEIGERAFYNCSGLREVTIPKGVTEIASYAFSGCSGLAAINVDAGNPSYSAIDGVLFSKDGKTLGYCPEGKTGAYEIPGSVTQIGESAFYGCSGLKEVTIPGGVTEIGERAFDKCSGLTGVYWLAGADIEVGDYAFDEIASPATLYVRRGEKAKFEANGQGWWKGFTIVEKRF